MNKVYTKLFFPIGELQILYHLINRSPVSMSVGEYIV